MPSCPNCGTNLTVKLQKGKQVNRRPKKDPNEPVNSEQFITSCRASKQRHVRIIGEWADELKLNGEFKTRKQWDEGFFKPNLQWANKIKHFSDDQISEAMISAEKDLKKNGGFMDEVKLSTVFKKLIPGKH